MTRLYLGRAFFIALLFLAPLSASASSFEVTGWMPYWRGATSTADVLPHLDEMTEVNPFVYTVKSDNTLADNGHLGDDPWKSFIAAAKSKKVRVIPTVLWDNPDRIHAVLSNAKARQAFEATIVKTVKQNGFDGIDIDFEAKKAETRPYFSTFLKGLYQRLGNKWLMCTIESRTPTASRYYGTDTPPDAEVYANDFAAINKYCDRVRIMTYDQQGVDQQLATQAASSSQLYAPLADPAWVEKVILLAEKSIKKSKILIGVPTYGYEYVVTAYANNQYIYDIMWPFNPLYATQIAQQYGITPQRNSAGELFLSYVPQQASTSAPTVGAIPNSALLAASAASMVATSGNTHTSFRLLDWSDAQAVADKVQLAKDLGVRGVSIFKLDGGEDPGIWSALQGAKK